MTLGVAGWGAACGDSAASTPESNDDLDAAMGQPTADAADQEEARVCDDGATRGCGECAPRSGTQYCTSVGQWSGCVCDDDGDQRPQADAGQTFDASADPGSSFDAGHGNPCRAGYYTGFLRGQWRPGAFDLGGGLTLIDVVVDAPASRTAPGVRFSLQPSDSDPSLLRVIDGCVLGTSAAIGGLDSHPFIAELEGSLDCRTGLFTGTLDGHYSLFDTGELSMWYFAGTTEAEFQPAKSALGDGGFVAREKQVLPEEQPGAGGEGTWGATWTADQAPDPLPSCSPPPLPSDAGSDAGDAGT